MKTSQKKTTALTITFRNISRKTQDKIMKDDLLQEIIEKYDVESTSIVQGFDMYNKDDIKERLDSYDNQDEETESSKI